MAAFTGKGGACQVAVDGPAVSPTNFNEMTALGYRFPGAGVDDRLLHRAIANALAGIDTA